MAEIVAVTTKLNERGILSLYNGKNSPVGKDMNKRGTAVVRLAKKQVGKKSRVLQKSIRKSEIFKTPDGLRMEIGSGIRYALLHHDGTRAHFITPNRTKALRFKVGGKIVITSKVLHPGTKPNPYLLQPLKEVFASDN